MPIINPSNDAPPLEQPATVRIAKPAYKGVTVDSRHQPAAQLLAYVEGSPWSVNYYSQVLDSDSPTAGQNQGLNPVYQQYKLIRELEFRVSSPLTQAQAQDGASMIVTGSANVFAYVIPNEGDMFLADVGQGSEGVFRVTRVEKKSIFKEAAYQIDYQMVDYSTDERRADLTVKTVAVYVWVKDFLTYGQNPVISEEQYLQSAGLVKNYYEMAGRYLRSMLSNEFKTLLVPGQTDAVYDPYVVSYVMALFSTTDFPQIREIRKLNVDGDDVLKATTVWDALARKESTAVKFAVKKMGLVSSKLFDRDPMLESIYHSGVDWVVYPKDLNVSIDFVQTPRVKLLDDTVLVDVPSDLATVDVPSTAGLPYSENPNLIHPTMVDDFYVLSEDFYAASSGQSKMERLVNDYLNGRAISPVLLKVLCDSYHTWGALERFYYVPILLTLIKASVRAL